jgi:hypothetical protein
MAVAAPPKAEKPPRPPVPPVPDGLIGLSQLRARKSDPYAALRQFVGKRIVFHSVKLADDLKSGTAEVFEYTGSPTADDQTPLVTVSVPKAAIKTLAQAIKDGRTDGLSAYVEPTARGVSLR